MADDKFAIRKNQVTEPFSNITIYNNKLYVGLHNRKGVYVYETPDDFPYKVAYSMLGGNTISDFCEDRSGGLWVLSVDNGLFYLPFGNMEIYDKSIGLSSNYISSFDFKNDTTLLLALWDSGLVEYEYKNSTIRKIRKSHINESYYYYIKYNQYNNSIFGGSSLQTYKNSIWEIKKNININEYFGVKKVSSNQYKNKVAFWGFQNLTIYDQKSGLVESVEKPYAPKRYNSGNFDTSGILWYGSNTGLFKYENNISTKIENQHKVFASRIEAIDFLVNGDLVLGTKGVGVAIWDRKDSVLMINTKHGLSADNIENIYVDTLDQIWVGTLNGLNRVTIKDGKIKVKVINAKHGLPGSEITQVMRRNDKIYVATTKGMAVMADIVENKVSVKPIFSGITNNSEVIDLDEKYQFTHSENNFTFDYVAINFKSDGDINYRYRTGKKDDWTVTKNTSLNFSSLSPAEYHFEIQAQNEDGYWSESLDYPFTISPPFWNTWWFYGLAALLVGISGYLFYSNRIKQLKEKQEVKDQLNSLERSALRAQMNPHFIFNILNSIQSAIMQNNKDFAMALLSRFAKLIRSTLKNARESKITLEEELEYLNSYLYMEKVRFKDKFEYTISVDEGIDVEELLIPPMLAQPLVENAIKYGMKNTTIKKGIINITFSEIENRLLISVVDNGPGLKEKDIAKAHKSLGMKITKERLELLNKTADGYQNLTVENLTNTDGDILGVQAKIMINLVD